MCHLPNWWDCMSLCCCSSPVLSINLYWLHWQWELGPIDLFTVKCELVCLPVGFLHDVAVVVATAPIPMCEAHFQYAVRHLFVCSTSIYAAQKHSELSHKLCQLRLTCSLPFAPSIGNRTSLWKCTVSTVDTMPNHYSVRNLVGILFVSHFASALIYLFAKKTVRCDMMAFDGNRSNWIFTYMNKFLLLLHFHGAFQTRWFTGAMQKRLFRSTNSYCILINASSS